MITKKRQQKFIRTRWENIFRNYSALAKRINVARIHDMRVDLKKLRALIFLQEEAGHKVKQKEKLLIKKLFKQAGKIREAQVAIQLIRASKVNAPQFLPEQKQRVAHESKVFLDMFRRHTEQIVKHNTQLWKKIEPIRLKTVKNTQKRLISAVIKVHKPHLKQNELHESRKQIKRFVYINSLLSEKARKENAQLVIRLKKLEDMIGKWHDAVVTKQLLQKIPGVKSKLKTINALAAKRLNLVEKSAMSVF